VLTYELENGFGFGRYLFCNTLLNARAKEGLSPAMLKVCKSGDELMFT